MSEELVRLEDCGAYAVITLNRPEKRNAMSSQAQEELQQVLKKCLGRYAAAVITGSKAICPGPGGARRLLSASSSSTRTV